MNNPKIIVGIDPDVDKSGWAEIDVRTNTIIRITTMSFFEIIHRLSEFAQIVDLQQGEVDVYVEAGYLNASNWHLPPQCTSRMAAMIGNKTGRNHQVAHMIVECSQGFGLNTFEIKPTNRKVDKNYFNAVCKGTFGVTWGRSNQEERDAFMLIVGKK